VYNPEARSINRMTLAKKSECALPSFLSSLSQQMWAESKHGNIIGELLADLSRIGLMP